MRGRMDAQLRLVIHDICEQNRLETGAAHQTCKLVA
jgi:hypothetical protein